MDFTLFFFPDLIKKRIIIRTTNNNEEMKINFNTLKNLLKSLDIQNNNFSIIL